MNERFINPLRFLEMCLWRYHAHTCALLDSKVEVNFYSGSFGWSPVRDASQDREWLLFKWSVKKK